MESWTKCWMWCHIQVSIQISSDCCVFMSVPSIRSNFSFNKKGGRVECRVPVNWVLHGGSSDILWGKLMGEKNSLHSQQALKNWKPKVPFQKLCSYPPDIVSPSFVSRCAEVLSVLLLFESWPFRAKTMRVREKSHVN